MQFTSSRNIVVSILSASVVSLSVSACSPAISGSPEASKGLEIAKELQAIAFDGMKNLKITEPECGFDYCNNDSSFSAKPVEGPLDATYCEAIYNWVLKNLTDVEVQVSYNRTDIDHGLYGCKSVLPTMFYGAIQYAGFYDGTLVQVFSESDRITINVDSEGVTSLDDFFGVDPKIEATGQLLNQFASFRDSQGIQQFFENNVREIVDSFSDDPDIKTLEPAVTWSADKSGKVREIYVKYAKGGLLPFCMSIEPWNSERFGADPGPDYMMILQDEGEPLDQFGFASSGECTKP